MADPSSVEYYLELRIMQGEIETDIANFKNDLTALYKAKTQSMSSALSYGRKAEETGMSGYHACSHDFWTLNQRITMFSKRAIPRLRTAKKMSEQLEEYFKDLNHNDSLMNRKFNKGLQGHAVFLHQRQLQLVHKIKHSLDSLHGFLGDLPQTAMNLLRKYQRMSQTSSDKVDRWVFVHSLPRVNGLCSICLEDSDVEGLVQLPCHVDHIFHEECMTRWLERSKTCPLDRKVLFGTQADNDAHVRALTVPYSALHDRPPAGEQRHVEARRYSA